MKPTELNLNEVYRVHELIEELKRQDPNDLTDVQFGTVKRTEGPHFYVTLTSNAIKELKSKITELTKQLNVAEHDYNQHT